eukprot:4843592-Pleurochrysis_carterae.AAC.1
MSYTPRAPQRSVRVFFDHLTDVRQWLLDAASADTDASAHLALLRGRVTIDGEAGADEVMRGARRGRDGRHVVHRHAHTADALTLLFDVLRILAHVHVLHLYS